MTKTLTLDAGDTYAELQTPADNPTDGTATEDLFLPEKDLDASKYPSEPSDPGRHRSGESLQPGERGHRRQLHDVGAAADSPAWDLSRRWYPGTTPLRAFGGSTSSSPIRQR